MDINGLHRRELIAAALAALAGSVHGQDNRLFTLIVPQPAGNATDGMARKLAPLVQGALGQTVIVENVPGAGGSIGVGKALTATGDGQTMVIGSQTALVLTPIAFSSARYRPEDFRCIALTGTSPYVLVARPDLAAATLPDLVALAGKPGARAITHGNIGQGTLTHLMGEQLARRLKLPLTQVPYKGNPPLMQDLMGGQIDLALVPLAGNTVSLIESGKVKAFGVTGSAPNPALPQVAPLSTMDPALHDFVYTVWGGVFVPAKTSPAAVQRLHKAFAEVLNDAALKAWLASTGVEPEAPRTLTQLDQFYRAEIKRTQALAREIGVTPSS